MPRLSKGTTYFIISSSFLLLALILIISKHEFRAFYHRLRGENALLKLKKDKLTEIILTAENLCLLDHIALSAKKYEEASQLALEISNKAFLLAETEYLPARLKQRYYDLCQTFYHFSKEASQKSHDLQRRHRNTLHQTREKIKTLKSLRERLRKLIEEIKRENESII